MSRSPASFQSVSKLLDSGDASLYSVATRGPGPLGKLPLTPEMLRNRPSGDAFGMTEDKDVKTATFWVIARRRLSVGYDTYYGTLFSNPA